MEYTEEEILEVVQRWDNTGLLTGLPLYEKQELAPLYDNVARVTLSKIDSDKLNESISDLMDIVMFPITRRLYRRVGSDFDIEKMITTLIKSVIENKETLNRTVTDKMKDPIIEFCVEFANNYEDDIINKKQFNDEEYTKRVDDLLTAIREILINKNMVSFLDRTNSEWKVMLSDSKKSDKQTRYWNQKIAQEVLTSIIKDTNKGI